MIVCRYELAVVNAKTVSAFKRELDSHWKEDMIRYGVTKAMPS